MQNFILSMQEDIKVLYTQGRSHWILQSTVGVPATWQERWFSFFKNIEPTIQLFLLKQCRKERSHSDQSQQEFLFTTHSKAITLLMVWLYTEKHQGIKKVSPHHWDSIAIRWKGRCNYFMLIDAHRKLTLETDTLGNIL